jgi:glycosyltransferase involved in cell wall biosynthesis
VFISRGIYLDGRIVLKILLCHNFYGSAAPSGENTVFLAERKLLKQHVHRVLEFVRYSDKLREKGIAGLVTGACATVWNPFVGSALRRVLEKERPDVMHVHNTFPLLSPSVFHAARGLDTAVVLTLHNFRLFCAAGIPMRDNQPCTLCLDNKSVVPGLRYGCYRNSRAATLPLALMITLHRGMGTWQTCVDHFVALTQFQKDRMTAAGLPGERVSVKPHFYPDPPDAKSWKQREPKVVYVGRLGTEKGIHVLVDAWQRWGRDAPLLEIIGDGPERASLERMVGDRTAGNIVFRGQLPYDAVQQILSGASLLVLPSLCFEGFPMVIREAFALGVPVAASRLGSMPGIVDEGKNGVLFAPGDSLDLLQKIRGVWENTEQAATMAANARQAFEEKYTAQKNYRLLMDIYQKAIIKRRTCS